MPNIDEHEKRLTALEIWQAGFVAHALAIEQQMRETLAKLQDTQSKMATELTANTALSSSTDRAVKLMLKIVGAIGLVLLAALIKYLIGA